MPDWLSQLLDQWPEFAAVFLGAAFGAVLTVWLTNRAYRSQAAEQAFLSLQRWAASVLVKTSQGQRADLGEAVAMSQELATIAWRSGRGKKRRAATRRVATAFVDLTTAVREGTGTRLPAYALLAALDGLGTELYGREFVAMHVGPARATAEEE